MDSDDMMKLFHKPMEPRKEAVEEAARILTENDKAALLKAADKHLRKLAKALAEASPQEPSK